MVTAADAARYVLYRCTESGTPINNWRLQNILYYLQIAFYTAFHRPCFEEDIEAWACGPVIPGVYFRYCAAGAASIAVQDTEAASVFTKDEQKIADEVIRKKGDLRSFYLDQDVKKKGRAWALTYENAGEKRKIIPVERLRMEG